MWSIYGGEKNKERQTKRKKEKEESKIKKKERKLKQNKLVWVVSEHLQQTGERRRRDQTKCA